MTVAVFDAGITHLKLLIVDAGGKVRWRRTRPAASIEAPPYRQLDSDGAWDWLLDSLARAGREAAIQAVIPCTHGSAAALVDERGLVLPAMHYESQPPAHIVDEYRALAPAFDEAFAPTNPAAMTLGLQLYWQSREHGDAYARAATAMPYPQYWAWRLSGRAASEPTSLGAQTHVWAPLERGFTRLAVNEGWHELFAPFEAAWSTIGRLSKTVASRTGLPEATPVLTGIHDSNANYLRYLAAGRHDFALMSTGTWIICFNRAFPVARLDPGCDTNTNTDVYGRPVACSRFMGGREYEIVSRGSRATATRAGVESIIRNRVFALPSFTSSGGPAPGTGGRGRIEGELESDAWRVALATVYCALMASKSLGHITTEQDASNEIIIDGAFAANVLFCRLVAALNPARRVSVAISPDGSALGAAALWKLERRSSRPVKTDVVPPLLAPGLDAYVREWSERAGV